MTKTKEPIVSVVIPGHNAKKYLAPCLDSIFASTLALTEVEVIVVDDASTDDTTSFVKDKYKKFPVKCISLTNNLGPSHARNVGAAKSTGDYLCFLDSDTVVDKNWALPAINAFVKDPKLAVIQSKLILMHEKNKIDCVGEFLGQNGFLVQRAKAGTVDKGQFNKTIPIFTAKSAGMFIRRTTFEKIGGFDSDYFIYVEETDLCWRSWLAGYQAIYLPESVVYHEFGTSTVIFGKKVSNQRAKYHGCKNYLLTLIKNLGSASLLTILPTHLFLWLGLAWYSLALNRDLSSFVLIHRAVLWNIIHLSDSLHKRFLVQNSRVISDRDLFPIIMKKKPLTYFLNKVTVHQKIGNTEGFTRTTKGHAG